MIFRILFFLSIAAIAVVCLIVVRIVAKRPLRPFARNLLIVFIGLELLATALHLISLSGVFPSFWGWFFNLQYERNFGSIFSALQLMIIALFALITAANAHGLRRGQRAYWLFLAVLFVYLCFDEFFSFHETFGGRVPTSAWRVPYVIGAVIFVIISAIAYWFEFRGEIRLFGLLFAGLAILLAAGAGIEEFVLQGWVEEDSRYEWMYVFEEAFEMVGATVVLVGFVSYAQEHLGEGSWRFAKRFVMTGGFAWTGFMLFWLLLYPAIELRLSATPIQVDYEDNELSLIGYRVEPEVVTPGGEIALTLYWRANKQIGTDYSVSVHALSHPNVDSLAQSDDLHVGPIPSTAWFPGVVMARTLYVQLPRNLPTPASYWMLVRLWHGPWPFERPWQDTTGVPILHSENRPLLAHDGVIVASVPALDDEPPDEPPTASSYRFTADGFTLSGYDFPEAPVETHTLRVRFWWTTTAEPTRDLTQFFHLVPESGEVHAFDQKPFGDRFPTADWPAHMDAVDEWHIALPDDLPAGRYEVFTGMYDVATMERAPVVDENGQPVANNAIHLGTLEFAPSAEAEAAAAEAMADVCYAVSDTNSLNGSEADTLVVMNTETGVVTEIGQTGGIKTEGITFNADRTALYGVDEREIGLFGVIDLATGVFTPIGAGLATPENPARNPVLYDSILKDIDSIALDTTSGELWGVLQDEENLLFQIDPETGEVARDTFGPGYDYLKIDLSDLPEPGYVNVKDMAFDPTDGTFYVVVGNDNFDSLLARIDFDSADRETGLIHLVPLHPFVNVADGSLILDVEGLSVAPDGTMYATSTNNSNDETYYDVLWRVDPATGESTAIDSFMNYVDYVDYEAIACTSGRVE